MASAEALRIEVVFSPAAGQVQRLELSLPEGSTVSDAIERSGLLPANPDVSLESLAVGVWGALRAFDDSLRDRDRVELYRPLQVDPKEARRLRHRSHREKARR